MRAEAWRYYLSCYRGSRGRLLLTVGGSVAVSFLALPLILLVRLTFDRILPAGDIRGLAWAAAAMLAATVASGALSLWIRQTTLAVTKDVIAELRRGMLERLYTLPRELFCSGDHLKLHDSIVQDTERVDVMSNALVAQALPSALAGLTLTVALLWMNWMLGLAMLATVPLFLWVNRILRGHLREHVNQFRGAFEGFSRGVLFALGAIDLTRLRSAESIELVRQQKNIDRLKSESMQVAWFDTMFGMAQNTLVTFAGLVVLLVGGAAVAAHKMTLGDLMAFYVTLRLMNAQTAMVFTSVPQIVVGMAALRDVHHLLTSGAEAAYSGSSAIRFHGRVELDGVWFAYHDERWALSDVSLTVEPGAIVGLVGPNGSGKSSIVSLLCGFYRPQQGQLLADGKPYDQLDMSELRRGLGVSPQEPLLFPGTVRDNICYGRPDATESEIREAAEWSTAHEAIEQLESGYDTPLGEGGMLISGGQRQRIAIARALLGRPKLLILDEPTNHLDADSIAALMNNLRRLPQRPAVVLVSHDPKIIEHCDTVYRLTSGWVETFENQVSAGERR